RTEDERWDDCAAISKDLHKLLVEPVNSGKSMFHVRHAADRDTVRAILTKYDVALRRAAQDARRDEQTGAGPGWFEHACWFEFFVLIGHRRGKIGGNRPHLYRLSFTTLAHPALVVLAG